MKIVVANFRLPRVWFQLTFMWLVILAPACVTFSPFGFYLINVALHSPNKYYLEVTLVSMWLCIILGFFIALAITKQLIYGKGAALWIEDGALIYVRKWLLSCPTDEIVSIGRGKKKMDTFVYKDAVIAYLRNGKDKRFPVEPFRESPDVIIERLNAALNLPRKVTSPPPSRAPKSS